MRRGSLRVLCVGTLYPPHNGGYELLWQAAVEDLRARGHTVDVLTSDLLPPGVAEAPLPGVHRELRSYWRDHEWPETTPRQRLALERHNARTFDRHVDRLRPDVVAWWSMGALSQGLIARAHRQGLPAVGFVIDDWMAYAQRTDQWIRAWRNRAALARAAELTTRLPTRLDYERSARWTFCSEVTRGKALEEAGPLADTAILRPGVDPVFHREPREAPWRGRLLYAGRLDPRKGVHTAIDALARLPPQTTLHVVGDGEARYAEQLHRQVDELGLGERVTFEPARERSTLADRYADADVALFPVEWLEPFGLVPLEAMAAGTPVVATGRGGSGEYLRDGENGILFRAGDAEDLARAVHRLAGDPGLRERVLAGGRRTASELTERAWLDGVEGELRGAVA